MPLFRGFTPHIDPYITLSYLVEAGGSHGQRIWNFFNADYAYSDTIENILTFELDDRDWFGARNGTPIRANLRLRSECSQRGYLTCSRTKKKYNKVVHLIPFRYTPARIRMFKPWGSVITEITSSFDTPEIPPQLSIMMIPVTRQDELPFDAPYPRTPSPESSEDNSTSDQSSQTSNIRIHIEPTQSSSQLNSTESLPGHPVATSDSSLLESGLFVQENTGRVNLVARRSNTPVPPLFPSSSFTPMATSTTETPTNTLTQSQAPSQGLRIRIPQPDSIPPGPSTAPPGFYQPISPARQISLETRQNSPKRKRAKSADPSYVVKKHKVTNSGQTLTREEALANRVRTPTPPIPGFRTPTPPVRVFVSNNNTPEKNSTISPVRPRSNVTINLPETPDTSQEDQHPQASMEGQNTTNIAHLNERMEAARAMNSFLERIHPAVTVPQMMNATIPSTPNPNWQNDPNPREQEIIPEHVALVVHTGSNTILRSLFFWERHDPWHILQSMVHEDVILYPNGQVNDSDIMDPRPWSPNHTPLSSTNATAGSSSSLSLMEVDQTPTSTSAMSMTCITLSSGSSGQSSSSISDMSISEVRIPEHDDQSRHDHEGRRGGEEGEEGGGGHATQGRHSHAD